MVEESLVISEFSEEVTKELSARLGEGYRILPRTVTRNNAVRRDSLTIHRDGESVSPVVYLDEAFEAYQNGCPVGDVADKIIGMCLDRSNAPSVPPDYLIDYGTVKDNICCRLVNAGMNSGLLSNVPHRDYMDLAMIFTAVSGESDSGFQSTTIQNCLMDIWGLDEDTLYETALENTVRIMGSDICPIESIIRKVTGCEDVPELGLKLYVATNRHKLHGAGVILYPGLLRDFSKEVGGDLYILPSSIHECIPPPGIFLLRPAVPEGHGRGGQPHAGSAGGSALGQCLSLRQIYGHSKYRIGGRIMTEKIKEQILAIRDSGETNMFDTNTVQVIANREDYFELVVFIEEHKKEYVNFILTGKAETEG